MDSETWLTAEDAVNFGLCDEILKVEYTPIDAVQKTIRNMYTNAPRLSAAAMAAYKSAHETENESKAEKANEPETGLTYAEYTAKIAQILEGIK